MISDFVKGKKQFDYPINIQKGIQLHRAIDTFTDQHHATKAAKLAWQGQFHRHLHQKEQYLVVRGAIASVSCSADNNEVDGKLHSSGTIVTFYAGVWHDILTTPGSEFVTIQVADPSVDVDGDREVMEKIPEAVTAEKERLLNYLFERH